MSSQPGHDLEPDQAALPWPNPRYAWYVVTLLMIATTLSFIDRQVIALLVGPIKSDLGLTDFEFSLLLGPAFAVFYAVMGLPLGRLADRRSRRGVIAAGVFFWSLATVTCGLARNFGQLFLARVSVGVGEAALSPAAYSMISDYFPREKLSRALSVYFLGIYIGSGLALVLGGAVIDMATAAGEITLPIVGILQPWQTTFVVMGLPGILFVLLLFTVSEPVRRGRAADTHVPLGEVFQYMAARKRLYGSHFAAFSLHAMLGWASFGWTPEFFVRRFGTDSADIGYQYGLLVLTFGSVGLLFGGWLADRMEARGRADAKIRVALYGNIGLLLPAGLFPFMPSEGSALFVLAIAIFFIAFPYGNAVAALQIVTPNRMRGLVSAIYLFVINIIGLGLGPPMVAALTQFVFADPDKLGWSLAVAGAITVPASIGFLLLCLAPYRKLAQTDLV